MPVSQGFGGASFSGMTLKAWVLMTSAGVLVKSFNVASVVKGGAGMYTVNFTAAMGGVNYITRMTSLYGGNSGAGSASSVATGAATLSTVNGGGSPLDVGGLWEFYE